MKVLKKKTRICLVVLLALMPISSIVWNMSTSSFDFVALLDASDNKMIALDQDTEGLKTLLERYQPLLYVSKGSYYPVDFYKDYLPQTGLSKSGLIDKKILDGVDVDQLRAYHRLSEYYLDYKVPYEATLLGDDGPVQAPFYARAYKSTLVSEVGKRNLLFLKYTLVYPYSGLPAETSGLKKRLASLIGNPMTWHELDIHGAIHVVLDAEDYSPLGLILAQHNNHQVLLKDLDFKWPKDDRVKISIAKYSNEPYLANEGGNMVKYRVAGNPSQMDYILELTDKQPLSGGIDCVEPIRDAVLVDGPVVQLPLDDPLYRASMSLGDRPKVLGLYRTFYIEGPVGVDYYARPQMLDLAELMAFWYIVSDDLYLEYYNQSDFSFRTYDTKDLMTLQRKRLYEALERTQ